MNYNIVSHNLNIDMVEPVCNRAKLDTGTLCNYKCPFCYYLDRLTEITPFEVVKDRIDYLISKGIDEVDLSGGESSVSKDWFKILDYCRTNDLKISTLSNGYKFANYDFTKKSKEHGLSEILFSLHGYDEESHNELVQNRKGFKHIIQGIKNANELGIIVRINCTVQKDNYKNLNNFVKLVKQFDVFEVNFITLNYWDDANNHEVIDYNQITPEIHKAIDSLKDECIINVRYTPYCFMKGYEKYVCNYYQHIYDIYDWNGAVYDYDLKDELTLESMYDKARLNRNASYYKNKECFDCKHFLICDGIENQIKEIDIHPENGEKIKDVNHYRKGYYAL